MRGTERGGVDKRSESLAASLPEQPKGESLARDLVKANRLRNLHRGCVALAQSSQVQWVSSPRLAARGLAVCEQSSCVLSGDRHNPRWQPGAVPARLASPVAGTEKGPARPAILLTTSESPRPVSRGRALQLVRALRPLKPGIKTKSSVGISPLRFLPLSCARESPIFKRYTAAGEPLCPSF